MKTIEDYAIEVMEVTWQLMYDTTDWVISNHDTSGDDHDAIHVEVMQRAIEIMYKLNTNKNR